MSTTTLACARCGDHCRVLEVAGAANEWKDRLYALGVIPGTAVEVLRIAPLGDPMQIRVGSSLISIRRAEAEIIRVDIQ